MHLHHSSGIREYIRRGGRNIVNHCKSQNTRKPTVKNLFKKWLHKKKKKRKEKKTRTNGNGNEHVDEKGN
jgi:hypothetical protein